jgi:hypothetical protein
MGWLLTLGTTLIEAAILTMYEEYQDSTKTTKTAKSDEDRFCGLHSKEGVLHLCRE